MCLHVQSVGVHNERWYLVAFMAVIAGEQITSLKASFTTSTLVGLLSLLMTLLFNHAQIGTDCLLGDAD